MKREDIVAYFKDATDEQVKALLDINSADITKALDKRKGETDALQGRLDEANAALTTANNTIKALEATKGDTAALQKQIDDYKKADADRQEAEKQARAQAELEERFNAAAGDRAFIHDYVRKGVLDDFGKALADKANRGKSDKDVFDAITKDKDYFASQNPPPKMGGMGNPAPVTDKENFKKLSLFEQFQFANAHPEQAKAFMDD
ncbi:MAG: hypothetical protein VB067_02540 [Christensenellaceae bacterium]|nr:hypothetical protein [Christensenellaceae bacterium]MEA5067155.1 hypothetical protein [Eubacteriales bacterium]MEA5067843.1 hypothetical protein [Christensenellaceae bacterium]